MDTYEPPTLLLKGQADEIIAALQARGFGADKRGGRVSVFKDGLGTETTWIGSFYWDKNRRSWRFYSVRPLVHTWGDLDVLMGEMDKEHARIAEIEDVWDEYKASKSTKRWKRYLGAVVSFYQRLFD